MRALLALAGLALLAATAGAGLDSTASVDILHSRYDPFVVLLRAGDSVVWVQGDPVLHTVTAFGGAFDSGDLARGEAFVHTFPAPGVFPYHCLRHPAMVGAVVVAP